MSEPLRPLVVIGVGNVLLHDDGIGVRVIEDLRRLQERRADALPRDVRLLDGGTLLLDLLHDVRDARGLVLIDAVRLGGAAGSVCLRRGDAIVPPGGERGMAPNSVSELLTVARLLGWLPDRHVLVGIEVEDTGFGVGLSPRIAAAVARASDLVCAELRAMDRLDAALRLAEATSTQPTGALA